MRLKVSLAMILSGVMFFSGCSAPATEVEEKDTAVTIQTPVVEDVKPEPEAASLSTDQDALQEAFNDYVKTAPGLVNVRGYVEEHIKEANEVVADRMVYELIAHGDFDVYDETDLIFEEANIGIHNYIYGLYKAHSADFDGGLAFVGEEKEKLMAYARDSTYGAYLEALFEQGYGLVLREGAYYPVTDYVAMRASFGANVSDMTYDYLGIMEKDLATPVVVEEYLAIPVGRLGERAVEAEEFLMTYKDNPKQYRGDVGQILATCLWKLSGPSVFDGTLKEDFTVSEALEDMYAGILEEEPTPVVTAAVKGITDWIETDDDGILGTMEDMDAIYQASNDVFRDSMILMDELYPMK